jgi:hypothetical protein
MMGGTALSWVLERALLTEYVAHAAGRYLGSSQSLVLA